MSFLKALWSVCFSEKQHIICITLFLCIHEFPSSNNTIWELWAWLPVYPAPMFSIVMVHKLPISALLLMIYKPFKTTALDHCLLYSIRVQLRGNNEQKQQTRKHRNYIVSLKHSIPELVGNTEWSKGLQEANALITGVLRFKDVVFFPVLS